MRTFASFLSLAAGLALFAASRVPAEPTVADSIVEQTVALRGRFTGGNFERYLEKQRVAVAAGELPSLSLGVAVAGQIIFDESWGWANLETSVAATADTVYAIGSISKSFTAMGIMVLAERGDIDLSASANHYLSSSPIRSPGGRADGVTVRHLLQMTGGVPHMWWHNWSDNEARSPNTRDFLKRYAVSVFPPGRHFLYSNLSYGVLEQIIANVSGRPYEDFMIEDVFTPLGMTSTRVRYPSKTRLSLAAQYDPEVEGPLAYEYLFPVGAGGFRSSVRDLLRFGISVLGHAPPGGRRIVSASSLHEMTSAGTPGGNYGLGFFINRTDGGWIEVKSNGSLWGGAATIRILPELGLVAVAATNTAGHQATDRVTEGLTDFAPRNTDQSGNSPKATKADQKAGLDDPTIQGAWSGQLLVPDGDALSVKMVIMKTLELKIGGQPAQSLSEARFRNGLFSGTWSVPLRLDGIAAPVRLSLYLRPDADSLNGYARAHAETYSLPFAVVLTVTRGGTR